MRKNDVRKWLHATLDLLPVILIPVFMVYSHRHTIDSGSLTIPTNSIVKIDNLIPYSESNYDLNTNINDYNIGNTGFYVSTLNDNGDYFYFQYIFHEPFKTNDKILIEFVYESNVSLNDYEIMFDTGNYSSEEYISFDLPISDGYHAHKIHTYESSDAISDYIEFDLDPNENEYFYFTDIQFYNLTAMYGSGNEPTYEQFKKDFSKTYYSENDNDKILVKNTGSITYNDTDIMSQFTYQLYNSVDKYFNMNNIFGFGNIYDWLLANIFNGNAPLYVPIVYNIILYEFVMDIIFLFYMIFMFIIDFTEGLITGFIDKAYGGGR